MTTNANCIAKVQFLGGSGSLPNLTIGNVYEVISWLSANGPGVQALTLDDLGELYVIQVVNSTIDWQTIAL